MNVYSRGRFYIAILRKLVQHAHRIFSYKTMVGVTGLAVATVLTGGAAGAAAAGIGATIGGGAATAGTAGAVGTAAGVAASTGAIAGAAATGTATGAAIGTVAGGTAAVGVGSSGVGLGALAGGGLALGPVGWLAVGTSVVNEKITYDCWKPVIHDTSEKLSNGMLLKDLVTNSNVAEVTVSEGCCPELPRVLLKNKWNEDFEIQYLLLNETGKIVCHALPVS